MSNFKRILWITLPALVVGFGFYLRASDTGEEVLLKAITENLEAYHYDPVKLNNDFSKKAFGLYMDALDQNKRLFLQEDIDELTEYESKIDDEIESGSYELFDLANKLMNERMTLTEGFFEDILAQPFDLEANETVDFSEDQPYAKTKDELKDRWRKYLKYTVLTRVHKEAVAQEKKDSAGTILTFDSLEHKARIGVLKTHRDWYKRLNRLDRKDRLSIYVNCITAVYDPHTNYFPPKDKENFDIQMSGQLEGIGAQLQEKDGYIAITNVVPGGPASLQGELEKNDLILKVAQEGEEPVEIVDWRVDDAVKLIRGKKGTKVTLTVRKVDGSVKDITITRDVVILEETFAKSLIIGDEDQGKAGYIYLPSFYADFDNPRYGRFSWKDVKTEVEKLAKAGVDGIILDLRNNGGGSLDDVVKMAGLFIDEGPVVQIKQKGRKASVLFDTRPGAEWDGALVIMVNEFSASASEIMAAAMQDYGRAIILGSSSTHGKGTVQRFLDLNQTLRNKAIPNLGSIKLTTQKFYRINGESTQLKGVSSDVLIPDFYMFMKTGEKEHEYAMPWDKIDAAEYSNVYSYPVNLIANSNARIKDNPTFNLIEENAHRWKAQSEEHSYPLSYKVYSDMEAKEDQEEERFSNLMKDPIEGFYADNPEEDKADMAGDESKQKRNEGWIKKTTQDPYIYEALQIIQDWSTPSGAGN